jgi:hypothetical protein
MMRMNADDNDHSDEVLGRNEDKGRKAILVIKWQRT